jgi:hypothetical protein
MNRNIATLVTALLLSANLPIAMGETIPEIGGAYGNVTGVMEDLNRADMLATEGAPATKGISAAFIPVYSQGDGYWVSGAALSVGYNDEHEVQFRSVRIAADEGGDANQTRAAYKYVLPVRTDFFSTAASVRYTDTERLHQTSEVVFALQGGVNAGFVDRRLVWAFNAIYKNRDYEAGGSQDALGGAIGVASRFGDTLSFSVDYEAEDDVNRNDIFSFTAVKGLRFYGSPADLAFVAQDDSTATLSLKYGF